MSSILKEETNYWPGYVDALINVLLNLLFLVGIFTVGLVTLNAQALIAQRKAAELRKNELLQGSTGPERQLKARALLQTLPTPPERPQQAHGAEPGGLYPIKEIRIKRVAASAGSADMPAREQELRHRGLTLSAAQQAQEQAQGARAVREPVLARFEFGINEYALASGTPVPVALAGVLEQSEHSLVLLVETDPDNPRLAREAFARLMAVRDSLIQGGWKAHRLQIRIVAPASGAGADSRIDRSVLAVLNKGAEHKRPHD